MKSNIITESLPTFTGTTGEAGTATVLEHWVQPGFSAVRVTLSSESCFVDRCCRFEKIYVRYIVIQ
jgi:hypothetical protein